MINKIIILILLIISSLLGNAQIKNFISIKEKIYSDIFLDSLLKSMNNDKEFELYFISKNGTKWESRKIEVLNDSIMISIDGKRVKQIKNKWVLPINLFFYSDFYLFQPENNFVSDEIQIIFIKQKSKIVCISAMNNQLFSYFLNFKNPFSLDKKLVKLLFY